MTTRIESNADYHDKKDVSASMLKSMNKSWRIFEAEYLTGQRTRKPSAAMELGTAIHAAALEPERFDVEFVTDPGVNRNTKIYKDWKSSVHKSMTIVRKEDMEIVVRCRDALHRHPIVGPYLQADGKCEVSHYWTCGVSDVPCKFRPDKIVPSASMVLDIKTISDIDEMESSIHKFGYHIQSAHYIRGAEEKYGGNDWDLMFAFVETSPPYRCRAAVLDHEALGIGFDTRGRLLDEYVHRLNNDDWSDPDENELVTASLPGWFLRKA